MHQPVIVDAVRTPIGRRNGSLCRGASGRPVGARPELADRAQRAGARGDRGRHLGLRQPDLRPVRERRPMGRPRGRVARDDSGHDGRPSLRVESAGDPVRLCQRRRRALRRRHRRRCRIDEPSAARRRSRDRRAVRTRGTGALPARFLQPRSRRRGDRSPLGTEPAPDSTNSRCDPTNSRSPPRRRVRSTTS